MTLKFLTAIILIGQNLIAQEAPPCIQAEPIVDSCKYPPAFNAPACIDVEKDGWMTHLFADASFLYWHGSEEGLTLAINGVWSEVSAIPQFFLTQNTTALIQSYGYHPGFKAGIGFVTDHQWQVRADFTWLRGNTTINEPAPMTYFLTSGVSTLSAGQVFGMPIWIIDDWFLQGTPGNQGLVATNIASTWHYAVDFLDVVASRPYTQGPSLTISPFGGLRAAWINQSIEITATQLSTVFGSNTPTLPIVSRNSSKSWGIGPRIGLEGACLFPLGFRLEGSLATDVLFTRYTKIAHTEDAASTNFAPGPYHTGTNNYDCLRAMAEMGLGFGWGQYFACNKYHLDFSATYDFTYMWRQNMMRLIDDEILLGIGSAASDFLLHGLTVTGRFDF